ncbi:response regulator transcription factor [Micromonospora sp. NPDC048909]|uniref:response regulator transcription factor n=1 Tax=Micromonospora sp. NPDC048909 TaxID=3155643 RepID=UPI0033CEBC7A
MRSVGSSESETDRAIRVLVVDDHQTFADLLALALDGQPALTCVGHARTAADALRLVDQLRPDVVLMDVGLPDLDGIAATELLHRRHPDVRVVVLTARTEPALLGQAMAAGAVGFLAKDGALGDVLHALRAAHHGTTTVSAHLLTGLLATARSQAAQDAAPGGLTGREYEVLRLMSQGQDVRAIARALGITPHTCRGYVKRLLAKLDAHSQLEAVAIATRRGLLPPADAV